MEKRDLSVLSENMIEAISKEWMLVTAGTTDKWNTMTASWGSLGFLWGRPVAFVFVRPERYTHEFIECNDRLTLAFLGAGNRAILNYCGSHSGRDCDKAAETGLAPVATPEGAVTFEQARLTLVGRKLYRTELKESEFIDKSCLERWYGPGPGQSLHTVYVVEIEGIYTK